MAAPKIDFIRLWSGTRTAIGNRNGYYPGLFDQGAPIPRISLKELRGIEDSLTTIAGRLFDELKGKGRSREMGIINTAVRKYIHKGEQITLDYSNVPLPVRMGAPGTEGDKYVWYPTAKEFFRACSELVLQLNGVEWAISGGIESFYQRIDMYMPTIMKPFYKSGFVIARDVRPVVKNLVDAGVKAIKAGAGIAGFLLKVAPYALVAAAGYWAFKEIDKRR
jgi:hypothetical protein